MEKIDKDILKELELDEALAIDIDEIEDLAEFILLPKGQYIFDVVKSTLSTEGDNPYIGVELTVVKTVELEDPNDEEKIEGKDAKLALRFYSGFGFQKFATTFRPIKEAIGEKLNLRELIERIEGYQISGIVTHRKDKTDKSIIRADLDAHTIAVVS